MVGREQRGPRAPYPPPPSLPPLSSLSHSLFSPETTTGPCTQRAGILYQSSRSFDSLSFDHGYF